MGWQFKRFVGISCSDCVKCFIFLFAKDYKLVDLD